MFTAAAQSILSTFTNASYCIHGRRIKTEESAKVVAAVWGTELIQFLAALAIFFLKKRANTVE